METTRRDAGESVEALPAHAVLLLAAVTAAVVAQGAYYAAGQVLLGSGLVAATVAFARRRPAWPGGMSRIARRAAALAGWAVVSALLAGRPTAAMPTVLLLAAAVAVLLLARQTTRPQARQLAAGLLGLGAVTALGGWFGVAFHRAPWALEDQGLWRAATSLTYANAAAGLLVPLALLGLARLVARPRSVPAALAISLMLVTIGATLSRAGFLALACGLVVLAVVCGARQVAAALAAPAVGAIVALAGLAASIPDRWGPRPGLAAVALVGGMAATALLARRPGRGLWLLAALALLVGTVAPSALLSDLRSSRATVASQDRVEEAKAALRLAADHPVAGTGPGQAILRWTAPDGFHLTARYAHNEYLQTLAELGVVGLVLLIRLLWSLGRSLRGAHPASTAGDELWAGVVAGLAALVVHSAFDFLWHLPAIPVLAAMLLGIGAHRATETEQP